MNRNNSKDFVWVDKSFKEWAEQIKAKSVLECDNPIPSIQELTKRILNAPSIKNIEEEILKSDRGFLKSEKKRFF